jgi:hypothetical protein
MHGTAMHETARRQVRTIEVEALGGDVCSAHHVCGAVLEAADGGHPLALVLPACTKHALAAAQCRTPSGDTVRPL